MASMKNIGHSYLVIGVLVKLFSVVKVLLLKL